MADISPLTVPQQGNVPQQSQPSATSGAASSTPSQSAVHFLDYWQILYSRKEIVIAVALIMIFTGIVVTRAMPRVYQATTLIQVQHEHTDVSPYGGRYARYDPFFLRTQFEIMRSEPIMEAVVQEMGLNEILGRAYGYYDRMSNSESAARTAALLRSKMSLNIYRDTDLVAISIKLDKPDNPEDAAAKLAADIANTVARVFQRWILQKSRESKEDGLRVLRQEIDEQERKIKAKENEIYQIREKYGLTLLSAGATGAESLRSEIAMLTTERARAELAVDQTRRRYEQIFQIPDEDLAGYLRILTGDGSVDGLVAQKQSAEIALNTLLRDDGVGESHPDVKRQRNIIAEIDAKIKERVNDVKTARQFNYNLAVAEFKALDEKLAGLRKQELEFSSSGVLEYNKAQNDLKVLKDNLSVLENTYNRERVQLRLPSTSVTIIDQAKVVGTPLPISPNFALNIMLSVVAGLFFGVVLTFFVEYLDTSIKTVDDVEKYIGVKVIGIIPQKILSLNSPSAPPSHSEPYRVLRTNLKSSSLPEPAPGQGVVISVTSSSVGEGKTQTLFNLAYASAEIGDHVCLIDTDLHRPRQHKILGLRRSPGMANAIVGEATLDDVILHTKLQTLDFIPAGELTGANAHGLLDTDEFNAILVELRKRYEKIFLDSPPMVGVSDSSQLVRMVDGVIMVVQHRKYPRAMIRRAKDMIVNMGGNLLGVVLNNINVARDYSSYYYKHQYYSYSGYGYGYGYGYGSGYGYGYGYGYGNSGKSKSDKSHRRSRSHSDGGSAAPAPTGDGDTPSGSEA